jgi:hypothetical protein
MSSYLPLLLLFSFALGGCASSPKHSGPSDTKTSKDFEVPAITKPKVNCTQVPDAIESNKWIEKHRVCIIDSPSTWSR